MDPKPNLSCLSHLAMLSCALGSTQVDLVGWPRTSCSKNTWLRGCPLVADLKQRSEVFHNTNDLVRVVQTALCAAQFQSFHMHHLNHRQLHRLLVCTADRFRIVAFGPGCKKTCCKNTLPHCCHWRTWFGYHQAHCKPHCKPSHPALPLGCSV